MSKEIEMYLEKNHLSYNSAIRNNVGELVGIGDLIDQNTKPLLDEIAELRKTGLESIKIAEDLSDLKKKYESRVEELQAKLKASKSEANEIVDYKEQYDNLLDILELRSNEYSIKAILANYTITRK